MELRITNAFTCTGAYAILIMTGLKRVENRSVMPVPSKGRCAVSCSKSFNAAEYGNFVQWASINLPPEDFERIPAWADVKDWPGKVIGACDYSARQADTATSSKSPYHPSAPWDEGYPYWWDLSEIVCFDHPIPCRGNVGMWQMPSALAGQVVAADLLESRVGERVATLPEAHELFRNAAPPRPRHRRVTGRGSEMAEELKFPVVAHHRIIVNAAEKNLAATQGLFAAFDLVEPVAEARASSGGKFVSFGLSVRLNDRGEMARLDEQIKLVPGLKMVL